MYYISKTFSFCYGHRLLNDKGRCRHLHGHTARAEITLKSPDLDRRGMVFHFDRLKKTVGRWIEKNLDHTLLLSDGDSIIKALKKSKERFKILPLNPTAENLARIIFETAQNFGLPVFEVNVWESETSRATYREES